MITTIRITRADLRRYADASGDHNPIHLDPAAARATGLPTTIAHGMLVMGLSLSAVGAGAVAECGARWTRPVVVPDEGTEITVDAVVTETGDGFTRLKVTTRCGGDKVMSMNRVLVQSD